jgi:hypothetical protein
MQDISRYAKQIDANKMFQTTRSAKEFRQKFQSVMKAVKEIAQMTQGTVDDAMQTFTGLRQQGFYTTADIKAQAASTHAREATTGLSKGTLSAVGGAGAATARAYGMRGRFGARLAQREVAGVSMGVRSGLMSEEEVEEMGGVEAVGMRMAQRQMGFLRSARGRAMLGYSLGAGGKIDQGRMAQMLGGKGAVEELVLGSSGRGLGTMLAAGTRGARESAMPYAGMMMVNMAARQQRELYGGVSAKGIQGMLGTMGVGWQESELMLKQTMQMPEQLKREASAKREAAQFARMDELRQYYSPGRKFKRMIGAEGGMIEAAGEDIRGFASGEYERATNAWQRGMTALTGGRVRTSGSGALARDARMRGVQFEYSTFEGSGQGVGMEGTILDTYKSFGEFVGLRVPSARDRTRGKYEDVAVSKDRFSDEAMEEMLKRGEYVDLGGGKVARTEQIRKIDAAKSEPGALKADDKARLQLSMARSDYMKRMKGVRTTIEKKYGEQQDADVATFFGLLEKAEGGAGSLTDEQIRERYEQYTKSSPEEKARAREIMAREATEAMGPGARAIQRMNKPDAGLGSVTEESQARRRAEYDEAIEMFVRKAGPGGFLGKRTGSLGISRGGRVLTTRLQDDGKAREKFTQLMRSFADKDPKKKLRLLKEMKGMLSPEEFAGVQEIFNEATQGDGSRGKEMAEAFTFDPKTGKGGMIGKITDQLELGDEMLEQMKSGTRGADELIARKDAGEKVPELGDFSLEEFKGVTDPQQRQRMVDKLTKKFVATKEDGSLGGLSEQEREILNLLGGTTDRGGAEGLGLQLEALVRGGKDKEGRDIRRGILEQTKLDKGRIDEILKKAGSGEMSAEDALAALTEGGAGSTSVWTAEKTEGEKSIDEVRKEYVAENTRFVQAVQTFASALSKAPGMDKIIGDVPLPNVGD